MQVQTNTAAARLTPLIPAPAVPKEGDWVRCFIGTSERVGELEKIDRVKWAHVRLLDGWLHQLPLREVQPWNPRDTRHARLQGADRAVRLLNSRLVADMEDQPRRRRDDAPRYVARGAAALGVSEAEKAAVMLRLADAPAANEPAPTVTDWRTVALYAACAAVIWIAAGATLLATPIPAHAQVGSRFVAGDAATYTDEHGGRWCVTVRAVQDGPGAVPWAWFTIDANPGRMFKVPAAELAPRAAGCAL